jgi:hypothetical protein
MNRTLLGLLVGVRAVLADGHAPQCTVLRPAIAIISCKVGRVAPRLSTVSFSSVSESGVTLLHIMRAYCKVVTVISSSKEAI